MIAIYTRLSIEDDESNSIENQKREGLKYAKLNNFKNSQIYYYDEVEGLKGSDPIENRPALSKLMDDIKIGKIKIVWVRKQSRISRKLTMFNDILEEMIEYDIQLFMGDRGLLDLKSPMTKMMLQIMSAFDEYAPNQQSFETKKSLLDNFNEGKVWGIYPYGYRTNDNMMPYTHKKESLVVKKIFEDYLLGKSAHKIANELNEKKVPTKYSQLEGELKTKNKYTNKVESKSKSSIQWNEKTIKDMLTNSWYNGKRIFHKNVDGETPEVGEVPRIVDEVLFNKVQIAIESRKGIRTSTPKYNYLLKGMIRCNKCGRNYYGRFRPNGNDNYYMCSGNRKKSTKCGNKGLNIPKLESFIIKHLFKSKSLLKMMESISVNNDVLFNIITEIRELESKIKLNKNKINRYAELLGNELKDDETILKKYLEAKKQTEDLNKRFLNLKIEKADIEKSEAFNNYKVQLSIINSNSDFKTLEFAVKSIIENILIDSMTDINGTDVYEVIIQYKGLKETSTFYTVSPYMKWINFYNSKEASPKEKKELLREEIEMFEFIHKVKLNDAEISKYIEPPQVVEKHSLELENIILDKKDVLMFNKIK